MYFGNYKEATRGNPNYFLTYGNVECLGVVGVEFPLFPSSYIAIYRCLMNYNGIYCYVDLLGDV
ncbi:hypothetical protein H5410_061253 [Solanum commersonii]|uniref:Uncharacterized protein n=1 Tax=Solanum commersonii TaxID=4109 RepID=A0A9J5W825_SOLCO|nr:hypothetical protein H5410_061253 [Solanum commersonii]